MSLYRQASGPRTGLIAAVAATALLAGIAIGYVIGSSGSEPSVQDAVAELHKDLQPVANGLQLIPAEYEQAFRGEGAEASGVKAAIDRVQDSLAKAGPDLRALDPDGARELTAAVAAIEAAVEKKAQPAEVEGLVDQAVKALAAVP